MAKCSQMRQYINLEIPESVVGECTLSTVDMCGQCGKTDDVVGFAGDAEDQAGSRPSSDLMMGDVGSAGV